MLVPGAPLPTTTEAPTTTSTVPPDTTTTVAPSTIPPTTREPSMMDAPTSTTDAEGPPLSLIESFIKQYFLEEQNRASSRNGATFSPSTISPEVQDAFSIISEYDPSSGIVNDTFFTIPPEYARANASCVNIANTIYIIGGVNLTTGSGIRTIDAVDILNLEFIPHVAEIDAELSNPSVATDFTSVYIAGGRLLKEDKSGGFAVEGDINRMVWRFVPQSEGTTPTCVELLPILPPAFTRPTNFTDYESELSIVSFAGFLVVMDAWTANAAVLQIHFPANQKQWISITWPTSPHNASTIADHGVPIGDPPLPIPANTTITPFPVGAAVGSIATCIDTHSNTSLFGRERGNQTTSPCPLGSSLILYRFGGLVVQRQWITHNTSIDVPVVSNNISASESMGLLTLPASNLNQRVISSGLFSIAMVGGNTSGVCNGSIRTTPCKVRLSSRLDCMGNAAGTFDAPWDGVHDVVFTATGASYPVYVCFSFGVDRSDTCDNHEVSATFYNTDALNPLSLQNGPITPAPPPSTAAPPHDSGSNLATLLYILGAVAAVTTLVAVLLVAKLRRVPDEGLIGQHGMPTVGYGTHQEERYKILGKIGEGAFSVVYLVARRADNVRFAMKHMECQSDIQRQEAIKECEIMRSLQGHPNVINLYDMFMNYEFDAAEPPNDEEAALIAASERKTKRSRHLCLVMEYHGAGDLRRWALNHKGNPSETVLCSVAFQVTSVLKHIHAQDPPVIHRDLKPENILIVSLDDDAHLAQGSPFLAMEATHSSKINFLPIVITDFGLARIQEGNYCASGAGTLPYVAPECFRKKYTTQCDMWSLGCVLYAIATKRCSHDTVRLMFQDCEQPGFTASITKDLEGLGLSKTFVAFILMLVEPDMKLRVTAEEGFKMFRKRDGAVFLSTRVVEEKSAAIAFAVSQRKQEAEVHSAVSLNHLQHEQTRPEGVEEQPLLQETVDGRADDETVQGTQLPQSETSIHSETRAEEL